MDVRISGKDGTMTRVKELHEELKDAVERFLVTHEFTEIVTILMTNEFSLRDRSDGTDFNYRYRFLDGREKVQLSYLLIPVDEGQPCNHNFWLRHTVAGQVISEQDWHVFAPQPTKDVQSPWRVMRWDDKKAA